MILDFWHSVYCTCWSACGCVHQRLPSCRSFLSCIYSCTLISFNSIIFSFLRYLLLFAEFVKCWNCIWCTMSTNEILIIIIIEWPTLDQGSSGCIQRRHSGAGHPSHCSKRRRWPRFLWCDNHDSDNILIFIDRNNIFCPEFYLSY